MDIRVDPKLFHDFHFKIAMSLKLPLTAKKVLEEFVDVDVNTEAVAKIVHRNQYFEQMLLQEIKGLGLKENTPALQAAIALLGMQRVRNFICALQMIRTVPRRHPQVGEDGKLDFKASDCLVYAIKAEEYASVKKIAYPDTIYAAGMMYDMMLWIGRELFNDPKGYSDYVAEVFKHGMKSALVGLELARSLKKFTYSRFLFSTCLIHDIGKLAMELLYPGTYAAFRAEIGKVVLSREVIHFLETKKFGLTHEYYGAQMAYYFQLFRPIERAVLFHHDPYILRENNKDLYSLACLVALGSNIANNFRAPRDTNDPVFKSWFTPELAEFKAVDPKSMIAIMAKVGRESF